MNLRDAFGVNPRHFKPLKDNEQMIKDGRDKIERIQANLTHDDIVKSLQENVV
jgi:hypothetical protein